MAEAADPFTEGNRAILEALYGYAPFAAMVKVGDRIVTVPYESYHEKPIDQPPDRPEILVTQRGFQMRPFGSNSKAAEATQLYTVQIRSGAFNAEKLNQLKWYAFIALLHAGTDLGLTFVRQWDVIDPQEGMELGDDVNRGTPVWAAVATVRVEMYWQRDIL